METMVLILVCVGIAAFGAWETARHRHELARRQKRRKSDYAT